VNFFQRQAISYRNRLAQSAEALTGIAAGLLADRNLNDDELHFLRTWLQTHEEIRHSWPGDILFARINTVLADGIITLDERAHLVETLEQIAGLNTASRERNDAVNGLALDDVQSITFAERRFVLTGDFVWGPRERVADRIITLGGVISGSVSKKIDYVVVGSRGSPEWKNGSYGTKIAKAIELQRMGASLLVVAESVWSDSLPS
jgi:NAD-dependent DNA ligase